MHMHTHIRLNAIFLNIQFLYIYIIFIYAYIYMMFEYMYSSLSLFLSLSLLKPPILPRPPKIQREPCWNHSHHSRQHDSTKGQHICIAKLLTFWQEVQKPKIWKNSETKYGRMEMEKRKLIPSGFCTTLSLAQQAHLLLAS